MKTLKEIQDEVSGETLEIFWKGLSPLEKNDLWPEVCRRAQLECGKATLEKASENAHVNFKLAPDLRTVERSSIEIDKESITSEENIVIIK